MRRRSPLFREREERNGSRPLDRHRGFPLMPHAVTRDPPRNDPAPFRQKIPQETDVLEVNRQFLVAKPAYAPALK
jgi:hypothetical protein